jgi:hypothetical protein
VKGSSSRTIAGAGGERAGERDPLLLPARQLGRHPPLVAAEPDQLQHLGHPRAPAGGPVEAEADVARHVQVPEQRALLRHQPDPPVLGSDVDARARDEPPAQADLPGVGPVEPGDHAQQRRLAAAGPAQDGHQRTGGHGEVDPVQHRGAGVARRHRRDAQSGRGDVRHPDHGHRFSSRRTRSTSSVGSAATRTSTTA